MRERRKWSKSNGSGGERPPRKISHWKKIGRVEGGGGEGATQPLLEVEVGGKEYSFNDVSSRKLCVKLTYC